MFCFRHADRRADDRWAFNPSGADAVELFEFLGQMGKLTWAEIERQQTGTIRRHKKHHSQDVDSFCDDAKDDFRRAKLGETFGEEMFRFRLSGEKRLWGFRRERIFHVVWWDPGHQVYRTEPN